MDGLCTDVFGGSLVDGERDPHEPGGETEQKTDSTEHRDAPLK